LHQGLASGTFTATVNTSTNSNCYYSSWLSTFKHTVKLGYSNIGFCDTLSIASIIINIVVLIIQQYSFITTLFLGPFDDVITKFYCKFIVILQLIINSIMDNMILTINYFLASIF
jgi:hypothetical protein